MNVKSSQIIRSISNRVHLSGNLEARILLAVGQYRLTVNIIPASGKRMQKQEVVSQIGVLLGEIVDEDNIVLNEESNSESVEDWDSLAHVKLIVALESHYNIRFDSSAIASNSVGELSEYILTNCA